MPTYALSKQLAELMVATGECEGTRTVALLTTMDEPLGRFSGNWCEVRECVDIMRAPLTGQARHPMSHDLITLSNILSGWMLHLAGRTSTPEAGAKLADEILASGAAWQAWLGIIAAQGGDTSIFDNVETAHKPAATRQLLAETSGYLSAMDCKEVGWAVQRLGAGRLKPGDPVSAAAGLEVHVKLGDKVTSGQLLLTLFADTEAQLAEPYAMLRATYRIAPEKPTLQPLVREIISAQK
jgi:pyrimidine-nucleoside phosphorylase